MSAQVEQAPDQDFEKLAKEIRGSYQITKLLREMIREELGSTEPRVRRAGLPQSEMKNVMGRLEELRKQIRLPADVVEQIIEEHRREFGRGPLVDEPDHHDAYGGRRCQCRSKMVSSG